MTEPFQTKLYSCGVTTLSDLASLGTGTDAHAQLREYLDDIGIAPRHEADPLRRAALRLEISRIAGAFDTARIRKEVETKENAQRAVTFMPRILPEQDWKQARKNFEKFHGKLADSVAPSKPYLERLQQMLEDGFAAESLMTVTTVDQEKQAEGPQGPTVDAQGYFRVGGSKVINVPMPKNSEAYRTRLETWGICWCYLRASNPHVGQLASVQMERVYEFTRWLFGEKCWGKVVEDDDGHVISTPTIRQVQKHELNIRRRAAELMDEGHDWWSAIVAARDDKDLRADFRESFSIHVAQASNRSVTAPGYSSAGPSGGGGQGRAKRDNAPPPAPHAEARQGKRARRTENHKKLLAEALAKGRAEGAAQAAATRRDKKGATKGVDKGAGRGAAKGQDRGGGKGAGKAPLFPDGAMRKRESDNKLICANFNKGGCSRGADCKFAHICWWCGDKDHGGSAHEVQGA